MAANPLTHERAILENPDDVRASGRQLVAGQQYDTSSAGIVSAPVRSTVQENETVRGQLRTLLNEGSPLLRQARDRGIRYAAGRGLQNSTLAGQAGEEAFISQALPIASQDASTFSDRAVLNNQTQNQFGLQERRGEIDQRLQSEGIRLQTDSNSRLQREQGQIQTGLIKSQGDVNRRLQENQGDINSRLQREQAGFRRQELTMEFQHERVMADRQFQHQQQLVQQDFQNRMRLTSHESSLAIQRMNQQHAQTLAQINANASAQTGIDAANFSRQLTGQYLSSVTARQQQASAEAAQIYQTPGLTSAQQQHAVSFAYTRMQSDIAAIGTYYRGTTSWRQ